MNIDWTNSAWQRWFRLPRITLFHVATQDHQRALLCHDASGTPQLYAYELGGTPRQLTDEPSGVLLGTISADGRTVYYQRLADDDTGGGHLWRVGFDGSNPQPLTPEWPSYPLLAIAECASGAFYGFTVFDGYSQTFVVDARRGGTPHLRYESAAPSVGPYLSYDGELAVMAEFTDADDALESYDVRTGERVARLSGLNSLEPASFPPRAADMRFLATALSDGLRRPFWWNARTGERRDLTFPHAGSIAPLDWSSDAEQIVYMAYGTTGAQTAVVNLKTGASAAFDWLDGRCVDAAHWHAGELWTLAQRYHEPPAIWRGGQAALSLGDAPPLPPVTITQRSSLMHYAQPSSPLHVVIAHGDEYGLPQRYQPLVGAWLSVGATVSVWHSWAHEGMLAGEGDGRATPEQDASALLAALAEFDLPPQRLLIGTRHAAPTAQRLPALGRILIDPDNPFERTRDGTPTLTLTVYNVPPAPDRDEQIMGRALAWWATLSATGAP